MKKTQFFFVLIAAFLSIVFLSIAWEFWLEDIILKALSIEHEVESLRMRLEYVISIILFVAISLIYPAFAGYKLIGEAEKQAEEIKRLSEEDYLTALYNRRKIHDVIEKEIIRSKRYDSAFSVILLDVDNFKTINDEYGHTIGDKVLVKFSKILRQTIRESDVAGRWGGEEFLIICPETTINGASSLAEKLRAEIEKSDFENVGNVTSSFGVASMKHDDSLQRLIQRADEVLYAAKNAGKNRVVTTA